MIKIFFKIPPPKKLKYVIFTNVKETMVKTSILLELLTDLVTYL